MTQSLVGNSKVPMGGDTRPLVYALPVCRYAVVPDGENGAGGGGTHAVPEAKRQRT